MSLLAALCLCAFSVPISAQESDPEAGGRRRSDEPTLFTTFGWGSTIPADRWSPVLIELGPMEKAVGGTVIIEYPQDGTQTAQIAVPFATTPGKATTVQAVAAIPMNVSRVTVTAVDDRGRRLAAISYGGGGLLQLPPFIQADQSGLVVSVGRVSAGDALSEWGQTIVDYNLQAAGMGAGRTRTSGHWYSATFARYDAADLPLSWPAYDAVTALIVNADTASDADPRAIEAIREWVRSGGRLVVLAAAAGDEWRLWLPPESAPPISLGPVQTGPVPAEIGAAIQDFERELQTRAEAIKDTGQTHEPLPPAAETAPQRPISLTDAGRDGLWSLRWTGRDAGHATSGLLAEGPVELGWVTVVGIDPARATQVLSSRSAGAIWRDALETIGADLLAPTATGQNFGWGYQSPASSAIGAAIERVGRVPFVGESVFLSIVICVLVLALLVGPFDYFVLRRFKLSQRSWLTALGWIGLAGLGSYALPPLIRTDPTQFNRIGVVDALCTPVAGSPFAEAKQGWSTMVSGLYASQSGAVDIIGNDPTSWWRGIAPPTYYWEGGSRGGAVVPVLQAAAGGEAGSTRGSPLLRMTVPIWTFRTMMDQSRAPVGLQVRIARDGQGWQATVVGLPPEATIVDAVLRDGESWCHAIGAPQRQDQTTTAQNPAATPLVPQPRAEGPTELVRDPIGKHDGGAWSGRFGPGRPKQPYGWQPSRAVNEYAWTAADTSDDPGPLLNLPGTYARTSLIDRYVMSERHIALYLRVENWPESPTLSWPADYSTGRIIRLVIALPESTPQSTPESNP